MRLSRSLAVLLLASAALQAQVVAPPFVPAPVPEHPPQTDCSRGWLEAEYLLWWTKGQPVPVPLVTSAPAGSPAVFPGALGNADTRLLLGNETVDGPERHGFRIAGGWWLSDRIGVDASYFRLFNENTTRDATSSGAADASYLALPYRAPSGTEESAFVAIPGFLAGNVGVAFESRLQGADLNAAIRLGGGCTLQADLLVGARWLSLDERLTLSAVTTGVPGGVFNGLAAILTDRFDARNDFYGGQVGTRVRADFDRLFVSATAKVALGVMQQNVRVSGQTVGTPPVFIPVDPNGFFAAQSNTGSFSRNRFAVVPEVGLKVGYRITDEVFVTVGYNFLYLSDVARPGNAIDRTVNVTQFGGGPLVGEPRPAPTLRNDSFWAHGLTLGLGIQF